MFEEKKSSIWWRVLLSFLLVVVLIGGGLAIYRFAFAQGAVAAEAGDLAAESWFNPIARSSHHYPYHRPFFPFGSFFFGFFFLMLVFGLFRRIIFGPRWARWGYWPGPHPGRRHFRYGPHGRRGYRRGFCHPWHYGWEAEEDADQEEKEQTE